MDQKTERSHRTGTYASRSDELDSRVHGDYSRWKLVQLYSGRWAPIWYACFGMESYAEAILDEDEGDFFHDKPMYGREANPLYLTAQDALAVIIRELEAEGKRERMEEVFAPFIQKAKRDLRKHQKGHVKVTSTAMQPFFVVHPENDDERLARAATAVASLKDAMGFVGVHTQADHQQAMKLIWRLLDVVGTAEVHPLTDLRDVLSSLVEVYEREHVTLLDDGRGAAPNVVERRAGVLLKRL
ncbi:hypothetical protein SAMN05446935_7514 [Burkholderia sp. YR290]|nr:hypothetical protein SAMN05446935_7514 [Burkholderia sp. YR290]